uniref:Uncharacterized protein n=1 Tax=Anguilla anguilla TaxID=7936 RepID=A0A0E9QWI2_ANGAN
MVNKPVTQILTKYFVLLIQVINSLSR